MTPSLSKETEDILRDLVAIPSISGDYMANHETLDYIERFLEPYKLHVIRHIWNGVESLVATTRKTKTPTVFLCAHVDVVPAHPEQFRLRLANGRYTGRGVRDMKGPLAAFLSAIAELGDKLQDYDLGLMIVTDEEIGGNNGAAKLAEAGYIPKVLVLPDGSDSWSIEKIAKGFWHFTIEATGYSAHGSRPQEGDNAIDKLWAAIGEIKALFPVDMDLDTNTISVTTIQGGEAINQIPDRAIASIDTRFIGMSDQKRLRAAIQRIATNYDLQVSTKVEGDTIENNPTDPYFQAYARSTKTFTGITPEWTTSTGGTDARFFVGKKTVTIVSYPAGGNSHGPDEWITQESLGQMHNIFLDYLKKVAKVPAKTPSKEAVV